MRHATPQERELVDVLTAVRHKTTVMAAGQLLARNAERYLKSPQVMEKLFSDVPEAIAETAELSARLDFTLADLGYEFPKYPVGPGETMNSFLRQRTDEGARQRFRPYHEKARRQIERELALIEKLEPGRLFPDRLGHGGLLPPRREFWCKGAARPPTARCVIRWGSRRWIRWRWICCSSASYRRSAANGPTSISTCPRAISASA